MKELIRIFDKSELNKLKVKENEFEISMQRGFEGTTIVNQEQVSSPSVVTTPTQNVLDNQQNIEVQNSRQQKGETINSPMVGTYYCAPSPESPAFVKVGDIVKKGQTLCILEAMKIMNEVEAEFDCKIIDILVKDASPVEYGMPIFEIEKI
ncbi:MAG: acetyl-CoA carboxylase, biotin carboxyl carrier protein [Arcobacter sp.]|nr:MAG: acetyl-CoA carboxylase, biotin carboxyl carrier protein [Arcobacter sp.]